MRPNKILNLTALALDAIWACLLAFIAYSIVAHTVEMLDERHFNTTVARHFGTYNDFRCYYAVGRIAGSEQRSRILDRDAQREFYCRYATPSGASCADFSENPYLPFFALAMQPLARLPLNVSFVAWSFIGMISFAISIVLLGLSKRDRGSIGTPFAIVLGALASLPALRCLILGQAGFIMTALIALFFLLWMRRYPKLAGVVMAISTFKVQFLPFTLIPVLAQRKWNILIAFAIAEAVLLGASLLAFGITPVQDFIRNTTHMGSRPWEGAYTMLCLRAFYSYLPHQIEIPLLVITSLAGMVLVFWLWKRAPELDSGPRSCWLIASSTTLLLLTSMYTNLYDALMLAIAAVLTLRTAGTANLFSGDIRSRLWWLILFTYPITSWIVWVALGRANHFTYHFSSLILICLSVLALSLVLRLPAASQAFPADGESPQ